MRVKIFHSVFLISFIILTIISSGCTKNKSEWTPKMETVGKVPDITWTIITRPPGSQNNSMFIYQYPDGTLIENTARDNVLSYWGDGYLYKGESGVEWRELDRKSGDFKQNPGVDLTSWDTPVAVDRKNGIIFSFGHSVKPTRILEAHFLNGMEKMTVNQLVADEYELLNPLPNNGWSVFFVDRPKQEGAITIHELPTRRMRIYGGTVYGGEYPKVKQVFMLENAVAVEMEDNWYIFQAGGFLGVQNRTMSLRQISGQLRPLSLLDDTLLVASDILDDDGKTAKSSTLHTYGIYTRAVKQIWDASESGFPAKILAFYASAPDDYLIVVGKLPELKKLSLGRLNNGVWEVLANAVLANNVDSTVIFPIIDEESLETDQKSVVESESVVKTEELL